MGYEYVFSHDGSVDLELLGKRVGDTPGVTLAVEQPGRLYFASSRTDAARVAMAKTLEYLLSISDSVSVVEL